MAQREAQNETLSSLTRAVVEQGGQPVSAHGVTALLESQGWTDREAQNRLGYPDVWTLGAAVWEQAWSPSRAQGTEIGTHPTLEDTQAARWRSTGMDTPEEKRLVWRGPYLLALALVQLGAVALMALGPTSYANLDWQGATAQGLGLLAGLVLANAFSQPLAREAGSLYLQGEEALAGSASVRSLVVATLATVVLATGASLASIAWLGDRAPGQLALLATTSTILTMLYWLAVNALLGLNLGRLAIAATMLAVVAVDYWQMSGPTGLRALLGLQAILAAGSLLMTGGLLAWWANKHRKRPPSRRLPGLLAAGADHWPFFVYGLGVMALVVVDRVVAWHIGAQEGLLAIQPDYEIGLAWALLAFLVTIAGVERLQSTLLVKLRLALADYTSEQATRLQSLAQRELWRGVVIAAGLAAASSLLVITVVDLLSSSQAVGTSWLQVILPSEESLLVMGWGLVGYGCLAVALLATGLIVALSQPQRLLLPLAGALVADLTVAGLAAQTMGYHASVLGLVAGAAVLLVLSTAHALAMLREPAYSLYAST